MGNLIGEEIKQLRKEKNLTQEKLAQMSGLTTVTINRAERFGKMRVSTYYKILQTLKDYQS